MTRDEMGNPTLIYMDSPYSCKKEDSYYGVGDTFEEYLEFMEDRLRHVCALDDFNIVLHVDPKASHYLKVILDKLLGRSSFINEIIWCYSGPSVAKYNLPRKHDVLLYYRIGNAPFNPQRIPYKALSAGGKTSWCGEKLDVEKYLARGKLLEDWWTDIAALQRNEGEKVGYKTQKPLKLLKRIIALFSNENDLVFDPMCGSGTTGHAALNLKRRFVGCDIDPKAVEIAQKRLGAIAQNG